MIAPRCSRAARRRFRARSRAGIPRRPPPWREAGAGAPEPAEPPRVAPGADGDEAMLRELELLEKLELLEHLELFGADEPR